MLTAATRRLRLAATRARTESSHAFAGVSTLGFLPAAVGPVMVIDVAAVAKLDERLHGGAVWSSSGCWSSGALSSAGCTSPRSLSPGDARLCHLYVQPRQREVRVKIETIQGKRSITAVLRAPLSHLRRERVLWHASLRRRTRAGQPRLWPPTSPRQQHKTTIWSPSRRSAMLTAS